MLCWQRADKERKGNRCIGSQLIIRHKAEICFHHRPPLLCFGNISKHILAQNLCTRSPTETFHSDGYHLFGIALLGAEGGGQSS